MIGNANVISDATITEMIFRTKYVLLRDFHLAITFV